MMKKLTLAGLLAAFSLVAGNASAADVYVAPKAAAATPRQAAAPVGYNWGGFYLGLNGGYARGTADANTRYDITTSGWFAGGQVGANFVMGGGVLLGLEGDVDWANIGGTNSSGPIVNENINWFGTARGRVGLPMGNVLPYLTGGLAWANATRESDLGPVSESQNHAGYVLGGGLEFGIAANLTTKLEYQYLNYGSRLYSTIPAAPTVGLTSQTVRVGVNFKY